MSYFITGSTVVLAAGRISNLSSGGTSGYLRLSFGHSRCRYTGNAQTGYRTATKRRPAPGCFLFSNVNSGSIAFARPPDGQGGYNLVTEYTGATSNDGFELRDWDNFPGYPHIRFSASRAIGPGNASATPTTLPSTGGSVSLTAACSARGRASPTVGREAGLDLRFCVVLRWPAGERQLTSVAMATRRPRASVQCARRLRRSPSPLQEQTTRGRRARALRSNTSTQPSDTISSRHPQRRSVHSTRASSWDGLVPGRRSSYG